MSVRLPNSCFVHIPRTGGLWLREATERAGLCRQVLRGDYDGHLPFDQLPPNWLCLQGFTFVRHPLAWLKSRWSHALQINAFEDHRHFEIHRAFDCCVRPTLTETVQEILTHRSGIVGMTYQRMIGKGPIRLNHVLRTENLPANLRRLLSETERIDSRQKLAISDTPPINSTTSDPRWRDKLGLPESLANEFLASEETALRIWREAK